MATIICNNKTCQKRINYQESSRIYYLECPHCKQMHFRPFQPISSPYSVLIKTDKEPKRTIELEWGKNIVGRKDVHVLIQDMTVSRQHCVLEVSMNSEELPQCLIYDIGFLTGRESMNGIFLEGREQRLNNLEQVLLRPNQRFQIGKTSIQLNLKKEDK